MKTKKYILALACSMSLGSAALAANKDAATSAQATVESAVSMDSLRAAAEANSAQTMRTVVAAADTSRPRSPTASARSSGDVARFYVGPQLGDSSIGASVGYQISRMFAMELSFDYVDPKYTPTTLSETRRVGASGLALFPIKFSEMGPMAIFFRVGYARTTDKYTVNDPGLGPGFPPTTSVTTTKRTGVQGGAGVQVDLSANTSARLGVHVVGTDRSVYMAALYSF